MALIVWNFPPYQTSIRPDGYPIQTEEEETSAAMAVMPASESPLIDEKRWYSPAALS